MGLFNRIFKRKLTPEKQEEQSRREKEWAEKCYRAGQNFGERIAFSKKVDALNRFYNVSNTQHRMKFRLNNIYTEGNYFFIDVTLLNRSNIKFDIEEIRVKFCDKRKVKNTNNQEVEIIPTMMINTDKSFKREYRNVIVLPKMTFPDEKVLTITVAEKQISGRTISLNIDYADVLHADSFTGSY